MLKLGAGSKGVYSYSTGFCRYDMPEAKPPVPHLTAPTSFRRRADTDDLGMRTSWDSAALDTMPRQAWCEALFRMMDRGQ